MAKNTLDTALSTAAAVIIVIFTVVMFLFATPEAKGATTAKDIKVATTYAKARGIYNMVETASPFFHTGDCRGAYYTKQNAILVACGKETPLDRALAVYLHELGHSQQVVDYTLRSPELIYAREVDAWNRGEKLARDLKLWSRVDKFEWEVIKQIGLHSYRQSFKPTWNFIQ